MIIIIHGAPGTGKTTLATELSNEFVLPHIGTDKTIEWLSNAADKFAPGDLNNVVNHAGYELVFDILAELSKGRGSFIFEGCFNPEGARPRILSALKPDIHKIFEIFLSASDEILIDRYQNRIESENRHSAHRDKSKTHHLKEHLNKVNYKPMNIGIELVDIDTGIAPETTFNTVIERLSPYQL